ncbi:hypothetical protein ACFQ71_38340 [Streptomyces sp. NPDC056534]|uniref:hypothetical protein n=1 Tax=Streptomyces sp. NPDC056534 TaxID=3345857 RepID=UPI0036A9471B
MQWNAAYPVTPRQTSPTWGPPRVGHQALEPLFNWKSADAPELAGRNHGKNIQRDYLVDEHPLAEEVLLPAQGHVSHFEQTRYAISREFHGVSSSEDSEGFVRGADKAPLSEMAVIKKPVESFADVASRRDAEKTAQAIEELTAAVRNIAICLNFPPPTTER